MAYFQKIKSLIFFIFLSIILFFVPINALDGDGYYHIKHSLIYKQNGISDTSFPWTQFSIIKDYASDLWYGFHILFIPIVGGKNLELSLRAGTMITFSVGLYLFFLALKKIKVKHPLFWSLIFLFSTRRGFSRFTLFRPHVLSFGLNMLLYSFLAKINLNKKDLFIVFLMSFFVSWIHLNIAWVPILVLLVVLFSEYFFTKKISLTKIASVFTGFTLGVLARPNPMASIKLNLVNLEVISLGKLAENPLNYGGELQPLAFFVFFKYSLGYIALILAVAITVFRLRNKVNDFDLTEKITILSSGILTLFFAVITFLISGRGFEYYLGFSLIFLAGLVKNIFNIVKFGFVILLISSIFVIWTYNRSVNLARLSDVDPSGFKEASLWLQENSKEGEIVYHTDWDHFGPMFFWNSKNYYINGMDPVFLYKYNQTLSWNVYYLYKQNFEKLDKSIYEIFKNDFKVKYIYITATHPKLYNYLTGDSRFKEIYKNENQAIFSVK